ncbi:hypothetical protein [Actinomadura sp. 9N215]|uniref:hypothetical protein n=1 Tax=Actinomadura sp. 9N215 TaxID=3375150 RepID=UPI0037A0917D
MGVKTADSEGDYEYFTAYTETNKWGNPGNGVFVHARDDKPVFRWGAFNRHPLDDVSGAAQRIRDFIEAQSILNRFDDPPAEV